MKVLTALCLLQVAVSPSMQVCTSLPADLDGVWTSTNLGTITISSTAMTLSMTRTFQSSHSSSNFECIFSSGTQYLLKMNETVAILNGDLDVYPYGCFDFRQASINSYYFYLNSAKEITLGQLRFRAVVDVNTITSLTDVCNATTVDIAEFNTMIRSGAESEAISGVQCPEPILGLFEYTYTDQTGTYCESVNTSTVIACSNQSRAELLIDNTGCTTKEPFYSVGGQVGCIANVYDSNTDVYYTSYYNRDESLSITSSRFTCVAMQKQTNGTLLLSLMQTDCVAGQSPSVLPTRDSTIGATMILEPRFTCPPETFAKSKSWTWLIIFLALLAFLIIFIIMIICLHRHCKQVERKKAREKKILITEEHPLGEMSIALDAPASMERVPEGYIDVHDELFISPKSFKRKDMMNPMNETSMNLNFREKSWTGITPRKSIVAMETIDPFSEMDSGIVMPISSLGSKTARSMRSPTKQKSFLYNSARTPRPGKNGNTREPLAITDGRTPYPVVGNDDGIDAKSFRREKSFGRETLVRSQTVYAPSIRAPSVHAPSVRAPSVRAPSAKAPSVKAPSVKAPSVAAKSTKSVNNNKALSIRTNKSRKPPVPKFARSISKTKIGSVTKNTPPSSPRKKFMNRSKTMVVQSERNDPNEGGMADFMNAEMSNWGDAPQTARSQRTSRTARSAAKARSSTIGSPKKSIPPRMSGIPNYFKAISIR